ncbi:type II toxin-antitoxin system RelE/ParE family toxin [Parapusillimonas sp. SGNA-6]|nr:type II toxin-antitoxin system RelE/ParE family toxin [Parapusillimonas sp. SGNA-6]
MHAYRTRTFTRWMRHSSLTDDDLLDAVDEMARGLVDAYLGGRILKKRIAIPGRGKSGGVRTIVAGGQSDRWFFIYGFNKNERDNVDSQELAALQKVADRLLNLNQSGLAAALAAGELMEVSHGVDGS